jgi:hypothetical protein
MSIRWSRYPLLVPRHPEHYRPRGLAPDFADLAAKTLNRYGLRVTETWDNEPFASSVTYTNDRLWLRLHREINIPRRVDSHWLLVSRIGKRPWWYVQELAVLLAGGEPPSPSPEESARQTTLKFLADHLEHNFELIHNGLQAKSDDEIIAGLERLGYHADVG